MTLNNDDLLVSAAGAGRLSDVRELLEKGANIVKLEIVMVTHLCIGLLKEVI